MKVSILATGCLAVVASAAGAQGSSCYPLRADSLHKIYIANIHNYTSDSDSVWSASGATLGFPRVDSSEVVLVRDEAICKTAARKFAANVPTKNVLTPPSGKVYAFHIGRTHYFVVDPDYYISPYNSRGLLFTRKWKMLTRLGS